jgi:hypothetical protein
MSTKPPSQKRTSNPLTLDTKPQVRMDMAVAISDELNDCYQCGTRCDSSRQNAYHGAGGPKFFYVCEEHFNARTGQRFDGGASNAAVQALTEATQDLTARTLDAREAAATPESVEEKTFAQRLEENRPKRETPAGGTPAPEQHRKSELSFREKLAKALERSPIEGGDTNGEA